MSKGISQKQALLLVKFFLQYFNEAKKLFYSIMQQNKTTICKNKNDYQYGSHTAKELNEISFYLIGLSFIRKTTHIQDDIRITSKALRNQIMPFE